MQREATIAFSAEVYRKKAVIAFYEIMRGKCAIGNPTLGDTPNAIANDFRLLTTCSYCNE